MKNLPRDVNATDSSAARGGLEISGAFVRYFRHSSTLLATHDAFIILPF